MAWFSNMLQLVQVLAALGVVILVLIQHGKGADMGAAFGSGSSGSVFGATGAANFLSRVTGVCATVFFVTTLGLAYVANQRPEAPGSVMEGATTPVPASEIPDSGIPATGGAASGVPAGSSSADANSQIPGSGKPESSQGSDIPK